MNATITRKKNTGEPGNPGQFGSKTHSEDAISLAPDDPIDQETATNLARQMLAQHHLSQDGWSFRFDNAKQRLGATRHAIKEISISKQLVKHGGTRDDVEQTLLHEIAHALLPAREGHSPAWRKLAKQIGDRGGARAKTQESPYHRALERGKQRASEMETQKAIPGGVVGERARVGDTVVTRRIRNAGYIGSNRRTDFSSTLHGQPATIEKVTPTGYTVRITATDEVKKCGYNSVIFPPGVNSHGEWSVASELKAGVQAANALGSNSVNASMMGETLAPGRMLAVTGTETYLDGQFVTVSSDRPVEGTLARIRVTSLDREYMLPINNLEHRYDD